MSPEDEASVREMFFAELPEWQRNALEGLLSGRASYGFSRRNGRHAAEVAVCASWEHQLKNWDVIGPRAPEVRREARELAARIGELGD